MPTPVTFLTPPRRFQTCSGAVRAIRFNPQEFLLAVATSDRTVKLYDIEFMELFCVTAPDTCPTRQELVSGHAGARDAWCQTDVFVLFERRYG